MPAMMKLAGFRVEGEEVTAVVGWLIVLAADLCITYSAQKQRADSTMGDDGDVAATTN
jgi:hypothetical protein